MTHPSINKFNPGLKKAHSFNDWEVSINGDLNYAPFDYYISHDRLTKDDWILHLLEKDWIDFNDFIPAYFQACTNANVEKVDIRIFYK